MSVITNFAKKFKYLLLFVRSESLEKGSVGYVTHRRVSSRTEQNGLQQGTPKRNRKMECQESGRYAEKNFKKKWNTTQPFCLNSITLSHYSKQKKNIIYENQNFRHCLDCNFICNLFMLRSLQ